MSEHPSERQSSIPQDAALTDVFLVAVRAMKTGDVETLTRLLQERPALANARAPLCSRAGSRSRLD